jgi:hypothetical protein
VESAVLVDDSAVDCAALAAPALCSVAAPGEFTVDVGTLGVGAGAGSVELVGGAPVVSVVGETGVAVSSVDAAGLSEAETGTSSAE